MTALGRIEITRCEAENGDRYYHVWTEVGESATIQVANTPVDAYFKGLKQVRRLAALNETAKLWPSLANEPPSDTVKIEVRAA